MMCHSSGACRAISKPGVSYNSGLKPLLHLGDSAFMHKVDISDKCGLCPHKMDILASSCSSFWLVYEPVTTGEEKR